MLTISDRTQHQLFGDGGAANQLNQNIDFRIIRHRKHIAFYGHIANIAIWIIATHTKLRHHNICAHPCRNLCRITRQYRKCAAADGS